MNKWIAVFFCVVATTYAASVNYNEVESGRSDDSLGLVYRIWDSCNKNADMDAVSCLKMKVATAVERAARMNDLSVFDGVTFVRHAPNEDAPVEDEESIKASLPRNADARDETLNAKILENALHFFQTHTLTVKMADNADLQRSLSAGDARGKLKKIAPLLLLPILKAGLLIPLALGALFLLAGKALIISKLALVLSGIIGLKKLFSHGHGVHETTYVSTGAGHGGGWGRSEAAQNLAYNAHAQN